MQVLLDTQAFIWLITNDSRLGDGAKKIASSTKNKVYISFLSFFEIAIKASLGKLSFDVTIIEDLEKMGIELISGDQESLKTYKIFSKKNRDPFDNFLIATAKSHNLKFLSSDHKIINLKLAELQVINATV